jgi:germination protein M
VGKIFRMRRLTLVLAATLVVAGCGTSHRQTVTETRTVTVATPTTTPTATTSTTGTSTVAASTTFRVYFLRDGKVAPVARTVPATQAVATAALRALTNGPSADERRLGFTTAVPAGRDTPPVIVANGVATLPLPPNVTRPELAQIVYTLTQFATVRAVRSSRMLGDTPALTRARFEDLTPPILVESPLPGQTAASPLEVRGTANTFEATFNLEMRNSSGVPVSTRFVTASSGSGERGTFDTTISFPRTGGPLTLVAYEQSAANGKRIHVVRIPLQEG